MSEQEKVVYPEEQENFIGGNCIPSLEFLALKVQDLEIRVRISEKAILKLSEAIYPIAEKLELKEYLEELAKLGFIPPPEKP